MTTVGTSPTTIQPPEDDFVIDDAQLAALANLARYSGRTLDAYRHDLRSFCQWASDNKLLVLAATRPHIELYRSWMEQRGLAASTIDRRLSTVSGFYRFAHIDGRNASNPAQYVGRPQVHPSNARGLDRSELGVLLFTAEQYDRDHAALAVLLGLNGLRVARRAARTSRTSGSSVATAPFRSSARGTRRPPSRSSRARPRTIDLAVGERSEGPILRRRDGQRLDRRTAHRWVRSIGKRAGLGAVHPHMLRAAPELRPPCGLRRRGVRGWRLIVCGQTGGGSIRSIVSTRSMDRSKEATLPTPVLSAQATRYASAKSIRSVSYTSIARRRSAGSTPTMESNARSDRTAWATSSRGAS